MNMIRKNLYETELGKLLSADYLKSTSAIPKFRTKEK
jgi:hypothetical protein